MRIGSILLFCFIWLHAGAQSPPYFGGGNTQNVTITSSPILQDTLWTSNPIADNTMNGSGLDAPYYDAARFLSQATVGFSESDVQSVMQMGVEGWLDSQQALPVDFVSTRMAQIYDIVRDSCIACGNTSDCAPPRTPKPYFSLAWWEQVSFADDLLRQRVAQALSQIVVISRASSNFSSEADGMATYFDLLQKHALGNYADLLYDVTLNAAMGEYLTHVNNPKTDTASFIFPDENYAREILQLFTIGLWELNIDGTQKLNAQGNPIPTYDNFDIGEYAKIFTGLSYGGLWSPHPQASCQNATLNFGISGTCADKVLPMIMYESQHEQGQKYLLKNVVVPAGQTGLQDIRMTIDSLVKHPNAAPFVAYRLIQRLVKSNPSPAYVQRVASVFACNGNNISGDLFSTIKAILTDEEARECSYLADAKNSKLREPLLRYTHFTRMMDIFREVGDQYFWNQDSYFRRATKQAILYAPSVFNFYNPDDKPMGAVEQQGLVAPEFKILDQVTAPGYANQVNGWTLPSQNKGWVHRNSLYTRWCDTEYSKLNIASYHKEMQDPEYFINWLDRNFVTGGMTDFTRKILRDAMDASWSPSYQSTTLRDRIQLAIYLTLISPDFVVTK